MRRYDNEKPFLRTKACGAILAAFIAICSLILVAITHEPKSAVSSPSPASAAIVPQIAGPKSEAEILLRGKSFSIYKRHVPMGYGGEVGSITVNEGQNVKEGDVLAEYTMDRPSMMQVRSFLYPEAVLSLKQRLYAEEQNLEKLVNARLPIKETELQRQKKELQDLRELQGKQMAAADAVKNKEQQVEAIQKEIFEVKESIKESKSSIDKLKNDLAYQKERHKKTLDLLEWDTQRSYDEKSPLPKEKAFLKAPIVGQVIWVSPDFRVGAKLPTGFHAMTIAPASSMVVRCKVHELDLVKLEPGLRGTVTFDALPDKKYRAKVTRIPWVSRNPALEVPADYEIECALEDLDHRLKEGMTCNVKVTVTQ
jgi:multidrug resistance efflux pump